jgi:FtsH-binding integral membrane protein
MQPYPVAETVQASEVQRSFILKVYNWMAMGLAITAVVSLAMFKFVDIQLLFSRYIFVFWFLLIFEVALVWGLSFAINKLPAVLATLAFMFYAAINGLTLSIIFLAYTATSIASTFFITAFMFGATSVFGYFTKIDLTRIGGFLFMALIGLIIASIVNIFVASGPLYWIISYAGVIIFVGLTAYDTQKIKNMSTGIDSSSEEGGRASVMGALALYLDFINLFLFLLRILGRRR